MHFGPKPEQDRNISEHIGTYRNKIGTKSEQDRNKQEQKMNKMDAYR